MKKKQRTAKWLDNRSLFQSVLAGFVLILLAGIGFFFAFRWISPESSISYLLRYTSASLGVLALGGTAVVQYRKQKDSENRVELERDMQFATRLTKAVEHLGSDSRAIRNGGLHELLRLAKDSEKDRAPALEIIAQFISHLQEKSEQHSAKDMFSAFLRRQKASWFWSVDFSCADFSDMILISADLSGATLYGANLSGANLYHADLTKTNLIGVDLSGAELTNADLSISSLFGANLTNTNFYGANLNGANLSHANLRGADLTNADLTNTNLSDADLTDAKIDGAKLPDPSSRE